MAKLPHTEFTFTNQTFPVGDSGPFTMPSASSAWTIVQIDVDRTPAGGLNSLTTATVVAISFEYSTDGNTWILANVAFLIGGPETNPARLGGGVHTTDTVGFSVVGQQFPSGAQWRLMVNVQGPSPVVASGTVTWQ